MFYNSCLLSSRLICYFILHLWLELIIILLLQNNSWCVVKWLEVNNHCFHNFSIFLWPDALIVFIVKRDFIFIYTFYADVSNGFHHSCSLVESSWFYREYVPYNKKLLQTRHKPCSNPKLGKTWTIKTRQLVTDLFPFKFIDL